MKKIKLTMFIAVFGLLLVSCGRNIDEMVISPNPTEPTTAGVSSTVAFTIANADSLITFTWSAADFGFPSSTTYALQLSSVSDFSKDVSTLLTTQNLRGTPKVSDINALLLSWNKEIGQPATLYYRVTASVTSAISVISDVRSASFTPYETLINYPMVYVPGEYQGWSPGNENGRLFSYNFNSTYAGIIRIINGTSPASNFKVTSAPDWNHTNWGGTLTKNGNNYSGTLSPTGGDITIDAGCYAITFDINTLAISFTKTNDWGVIGSATADGWNSDQNMFYNGQRKMWELTANLTVGEIKFRANDGWDINYGDTGANGTLEAGGDNIAISTAGNYTIRFSTETLLYTVKKN
jgi:starch-binding outer membrane protein SusE/F